MKKINMPLNERLNKLQAYIEKEKYLNAWDELESILAQAEHELCTWQTCQKLIDYLDQLYRLNPCAQKRDIFFYKIRTHLIQSLKIEKRAELLIKISECYEEEESALWYLAEALELSANKEWLQRLSMLEDKYYLKHFSLYSKLVSELKELEKLLPEQIQSFLKAKNKTHQLRCHLMRQLKKLIEHQSDLAALQTAYQRYKTFLEDYCTSFKKRWELYFIRHHHQSEALEIVQYPVENLTSLLSEFLESFHFILGWENKIKLPKQTLACQLRRETWDKYEHLNEKEISQDLESICNQIQSMISDLESVAFPYQPHIQLWSNFRAHHHKIKRNFLEIEKDELERHEIFQDALSQLLGSYLQSLSDSCIPPPCHWCLCTMGSNARGDGSTRSDLDITLIIEKEEYVEHPFFQALLHGFQSFVISLGGNWEWNEQTGFQSLGFQIDKGDLTISKNRIIGSIQTPQQLIEKVLFALLNYDKRSSHDFIMAFSLLLVKPIYATDLNLLNQYQKGLHHAFSKINLASVGWNVIKSVQQDITQIKNAKELKNYIKPIHLILLGLYCLEPNPNFISFKWSRIYSILPKYLNQTFLEEWRRDLKILYAFRRSYQEENLKSEVLIKSLSESQPFLSNLQQSLILFSEGLPKTHAQFQKKIYCPYQSYVAKHYIKLPHEKILHLLQTALQQKELIELPIELTQSLWQKEGDIILKNKFNDLSTFNLLVQVGIYPDTPIANKSLIEHAFEQKNAQAMIALLNQGAGRNSYFPFQIWIEFLSKAAPHAFEKVLTNWIQNNSAVAWYVTKKILFEPLPQRERTKEELARFVEGIDSKQILLKKEVFQRLPELINYTEKNKDNSFGRAVVKKIKSENQMFCFKLFPEAAPMEDAAQQLAHAYFPGTVPHSELIRYDNAKETIPVLISEGIIGYNLQDVFNALSDNPIVRQKALKNGVTPEIAKDCMEHIDHYSFSQQLLLTLLTNDEDGKPDNKYFVPFKQGNQTLYRIVSVDNDHSFLEPILMGNKGNQILQLKSIVLCLNNMKKPLHPQVVEAFLDLNSSDCIENWLKKLNLRQMRYAKLFDSSDAKKIDSIREELVKKDVILQFVFPKKSISKLWSKWQKIKQCLMHNPDFTGLKLLKYVMPAVAHFYMGAFNEETPSKRFHYIGQKSYISILLGKTLVGYQTSTKSTQLLAAQGIKEKHLIEKNKVDLGETLKEIQLITQEHTQLDNILKRLEQGIFEYEENGKKTGLKYLYDSNHKAKVINQLDWYKLKSEDAQALLNIILDNQFDLDVHQLILRNCTHLNDSQLEILLKKMPNLREFILQGSLVSDSLWKNLQKYCKVIEFLTLKQVPNLSTSGQDAFWRNPLELLLLLELQIEDAPSFFNLHLKAPNLKKLTLKNLASLNNIRTNSFSLEQFEISECPQLNLEGLILSFQTADSFKSGRLPKHWKNRSGTYELFVNHPFLLACSIFNGLTEFETELSELISTLKTFPLEIINSKILYQLKLYIELNILAFNLQKQTVPVLRNALKYKNEVVARSAATALFRLNSKYTPSMYIEETSSLGNAMHLNWVANVLGEPTDIQSILQAIHDKVIKNSEFTLRLGLDEKPTPILIIQALCTMIRQEDWLGKNLAISIISYLVQCIDILIPALDEFLAGKLEGYLNKKELIGTDLLWESIYLNPTQLPLLTISEDLTENQLILVLQKAIVTCHDLTVIQICGLKLQQHIAFPLIQELIAFNKNSLQHLNLGQNLFGDVLIKKLSCETLSECRNLIDLNLQGNQITNLAMKDLALLFYDCPIEDLVLNENQIEAVGISSFVRALPEKTKFNSLCLNHNPIGTLGIEYLAKTSTAFNHSMLYLDNTELDNETHSALKVLLPKLRIISLKQNRLTTLEWLLEILPTCKNLERCILEENLFSQADFSTFIQHIQGLSLNPRLLKNLQQQAAEYVAFQISFSHSNKKVNLSSLSVFSEPLKRKELKNKDKFQKKLSPYLNTNFVLAETVEQSDSFFDACAQVLNNRFNDRDCYSIKSLRLLCDHYAKSQQGKWIEETFKKDKFLISYEEYLTWIQFDCEEMEKNKQEGLGHGSAIWGSLNIDGKIICQTQQIKLHVIEIDKEHKVAHQLITPELEIESINEETALELFKMQDCIHFVCYDQHFVPILSQPIKPEKNKIFSSKLLTFAPSKTEDHAVSDTKSNHFLTQNYYFLMQNALEQLSSVALPETWANENHIIHYLHMKLQKANIIVPSQVWNLENNIEELKHLFEQEAFPLHDFITLFWSDDNQKKFIVPILDKGHFYGLVISKKNSGFLLEYFDPADSANSKTQQSIDLLLKMNQLVSLLQKTWINLNSLGDNVPFCINQHRGEIKASSVKHIKQLYSKVPQIEMNNISMQQQYLSYDCGYIVAQTLYEKALDQPISIQTFDLNHPEQSIQSIAEVRHEFYSPQMGKDTVQKIERNAWIVRLAQALTKSKYSASIKQFILSNHSFHSEKLKMISQTFKEPTFETQPEIILNQCLAFFSLASIKQFISELLEPEINEQGVVQFKLHSKLIAQQPKAMEEEKPFLKFG